MPYDLSKLLVVGISSRALFDLEEEDRIFQIEGLQKFLDYQRSHEDETLPPGSAFALIKGLLGLNGGSDGRKVEVILMSKNHPDVSLRVFNSIDKYGLEMSRAALTGGESLGPYLGPFHVGLFLSQSVEDVQLAANQGVAAGLIYSPPPDVQTVPGQIRIAFDGDCVIFSDEAQRIFDKHGLKEFQRYEEANAKKELPDGPFAKLLRFLSENQGPDPEKSPFRISLVTDRNMPAHERVIRTLRAWNVRLDAAFFLGGISKTEVLKAFGAHMFFDDKEEYCKHATEKVPTTRVLMPTRRAVMIETTVRVATGNGDTGQERFLFICKGYLKREFQTSEVELKDWYDLKVQGWPVPSQSVFLDELALSVQETPRGDERRASSEEDNAKAKLLTFLENLLSKHGPK